MRKHSVKELNGHYLNLKILRQISSSFVHGQKISFFFFLSRWKEIRLNPGSNPEPFKKYDLFVCFVQCVSGTIPGPVAMGRLFDSNCAYWRRGCGNTTENCLVYDNRNDRLMILTENCNLVKITTY
jgi:hypothetical protein